MSTTMTFVLPSAPTTELPVITSVSIANLNDSLLLIVGLDNKSSADNAEQQNSPVAELFSPKPIRRVSIEKIQRLASLTETNVEAKTIPKAKARFVPPTAIRNNANAPTMTITNSKSAINTTKTNTACCCDSCNSRPVENNDTAPNPAGNLVFVANNYKYTTTPITPADVADLRREKRKLALTTASSVLLGQGNGKSIPAAAAAAARRPLPVASILRRERERRREELEFSIKKTSSELLNNSNGNGNGNVNTIPATKAPVHKTPRYSLDDPHYHPEIAIKPTVKTKPRYRASTVDRFFTDLSFPTTSSYHSYHDHPTFYHSPEPTTPSYYPTTTSYHPKTTTSYPLSSASSSTNSTPSPFSTLPSSSYLNKTKTTNNVFYKTNTYNTYYQANTAAYNNPATTKYLSELFLGSVPDYSTRRQCGDVRGGREVEMSC